MFTSKQRAKLRSLASGIKPIGQVGKEGISDTMINGLTEALEARELIKITLLQTAGEDQENIALNLADLLNAELVAVIGRKAILYRRSSRPEIQHLEF